MSSGAANDDGALPASEQITSLSRKAESNAKLAIEADENGETDFAFWRYIDAIEALRLLALNTSCSSNSNGAPSSVANSPNRKVAVSETLLKSIEQYLSRAEQLKVTMMEPPKLKSEEGKWFFFQICAFRVAGLNSWARFDAAAVT